MMTNIEICMQVMSKVIVMIQVGDQIFNTNKSFHFNFEPLINETLFVSYMINITKK